MKSRIERPRNPLHHGLRNAHALLPVAFTVAVLCLFFGQMPLLKANVPGGIVSGSSAAVTVTDGGTTVTLSNGIAAIIITKTDATIHSMTYSYNNSGVA